MIRGRSIRIHLGAGAVGRSCKLTKLMNPCFSREVFNHPMLTRPMIGYFIFYHFEASSMGFQNQFLEPRIGSIARIYLIQIGLGIAVIGIGRFIVLQEGRGPNRCCTYFFNIIQVLHNSPDVTPVTTSR